MRRLIFLLLFLATLIVPGYFVKAITLGGLDKTAQVAGIKNATTSPEEATGKILNQIISLVGIIFFLLLLVAGTIWMTAMGDEKKIDKARQMIVAAVIGLIIVAGAYAITNFVGSSFISPTTTNTP